MFLIDTVAVMGATEAGGACAVVAALAGCAVRLQDVSLALARAADAVRTRVLERAAAFAAPVNEAAGAP